MKRGRIVILLICMIGVLGGWSFASESEVPAPTLEQVSKAAQEEDGIFVDWTDVQNASEYKVRLEGTVTYYDSDSMTRPEMSVNLVFVTSEIAAGSAGDSQLQLPKKMLVEKVFGVLAEQGVAREKVPMFLVEGKAMVHALGGDKKESQSSNSRCMPPILWKASKD